MVEKMILPRWMRVLVIVITIIYSIIILIFWLALIFGFGTYGKEADITKSLLTMGINTIIALFIWIYIKRYWKAIIAKD